MAEKRKGCCEIGKTLGRISWDTIPGTETCSSNDRGSAAVLSLFSSILTRIYDESNLKYSASLA